MEFEDFRLRIEASTETSYLALATTADGEEASCQFTLPFGASDLENLVLRIGRPRQTRRARAASEVKRVESFGDALFTSVFQGDVKDILRKARARADADGRGVRIVLSLSHAPTLLDLPWEFLYDRRSSSACSGALRSSGTSSSRTVASLFRSTAA